MLNKNTDSEIKKTETAEIAHDKGYDMQLEEEIIRKIEQMESSDYVFPQRMKKGNYIFIAVAVIFCIAAIIYGAGI